MNKNNNQKEIASYQLINDDLLDDSDYLEDIDPIDQDNYEGGGEFSWDWD